MVRFQDIFKKLKPADTGESAPASEKPPQEAERPVAEQQPLQDKLRPEPNREGIGTPLGEPSGKPQEGEQSQPSLQTLQDLFRSVDPKRSDAHKRSTPYPLDVTSGDKRDGVYPEPSIKATAPPRNNRDSTAAPPRNNRDSAAAPQEEIEDAVITPNGASLKEAVPSGTPLESHYTKAMTQLSETKGTEQAERRPRSEPLNLSGAIKAQQTQDTQKATQLYEQLSSLSKMLLERVERKISLKDVNIKEITGVIQEMVSFVVSGDQSLMALTSRSSPANYLIAHMVNTTIMSAEIGKGIGYNPSKLEELAMVTFLHDLGMQKVISIVYDNAKLSPEEYERVKTHILEGVNMLKEIGDILQITLDACYQHHERISGTGYQGLSGKMISGYAQIIGLVDTFEAITHFRPYRRQKTSQAAIKELIEMAGDFDMNILRVLVKHIGIYPVGTWVELNTGEIARVVKINESSPIRPTVTVMLTADKNTIEEARTIDLTKYQNVYIKTSLDEKELINKQWKSARTGGV